MHVHGEGTERTVIPIAGAVVAAFFFGWLLGSPASIEPNKVEIIAMAWSSDGRFLVYEAWNSALEFYDTATDTTTRVPLSEIVDEIRVNGALDPG